MESPERPASLPVVPPEKQEHFENMLSYLGLKNDIKLLYASLIELKMPL